ncbi:MAG TPA: type II toxin-antitoxin system HicB family antitoxin [Steroidobacteraceae bacterium]|jgi:predicted RNase H-like HicB family nuclease|nr:type II toxin-antitoxin system HicB family antitoxin [Steroidobacteraceae bacterium]
MIAVKVADIGSHAREDTAGPTARGSNALRQVLLLRGEGGYWVAECPSLPGCTGEGGTREGAIESVKESIAAYLADLEECGLPVPEERFDALIAVV